MTHRVKKRVVAEPFVRFVAPIFLVTFLFAGVVGAQTTIQLALGPGSGSTIYQTVEQLVDRFHKEQTDVRVEITTGVSFDKLLTMLAGGIEPDIAWAELREIAQLIDQGALYPFEDILPPSEQHVLDPNDLFGGIREVAIREGKWWALGAHAGGNAFFYNTRLFDEAGLPSDRAPQTWDQVDEYGIKLTRDTNGDGQPDVWGAGHATYTRGSSLAWRWTPYLWQAGGRLFDERGQPAFHLEHGIEASEYLMRATHETGYSYSDRDTQNVFRDQRMGMLYSATGFVGALDRDGVPYRSAEMPQREQRAAALGGHYFIVTRDAQRDATGKFLAWFMKPENHAEYSMNSGNPLPTRRSIGNVPKYQDFLADNPQLLPLVNQMEYIQPSFYGILANEIGTIIGDAVLESVIERRVPPSSALGQAAETIRSLMEERCEELRGGVCW